MNRLAAIASRKNDACATALLQPNPHSAIWSGFSISRASLMYCGLLIGATLAVYIQARGFDFIFMDDPVYVGDNPSVRSGVTLENVRWAFATFRDGNWFPLTWISLMLDASAYGTWPGGYHLTNVALHVANSLLVFATFSRMTGRVPQSACVAALFAVHPLHVESVAWIAERKDMLSMFFGLCSIYAYVRYSQSGRIRAIALSVVFFLCSLCSKQTFVTLPFVLLLLDYWPLGRLVSLRPMALRNDPAVGDKPNASRGLPASLLIEKIPFFALSAAFCVVAFFAQSRGGAVLSLEVVPLGIRLLNALVVYRLYLQKALFPTGLIAYYPHPGSLLGPGDVVISVIFLSAVTGFVLFNARRRPYLLVGWLWYLGTLVPMIGLVQLSGQQMADRYTYLPLLGCYLAIVWFVTSLATRLATPKFVLPTIAVGLVAVYGSTAYVQAGYWRDSISLFGHAVAVGKTNPFSLTSLGWAFINANRFEEAAVPLRKAVELTPDFGEAQFLLGCVLQKQSKLNEAADRFRKALASDGRNAAAHLNLGLILMARREYADARREFDRALDLDKDNARVQAGLAELSLRQRQYQQAIAYAKRGLDLDPSETWCRRLIIMALRDQGQFDAAIEQVRQMLADAPDDRASQRELEQLLAKRSRQSGSPGP